mmetsp:Transcript_14551/g.41493  ORF Transcript_14551/g.41493 Transcript_14551/m.41493 type:complete len:270 (+) Transcript_14551:3262-4071(+)
MDAVPLALQVQVELRRLLANRARYVVVAQLLLLRNVNNLHRKGGVRLDASARRLELKNCFLGRVLVARGVQVESKRNVLAVDEVDHLVHPRAREHLSKMNVLPVEHHPWLTHNAEQQELLGDVVPGDGERPPRLGGLYRIWDELKDHLEFLSWLDLSLSGQAPEGARPILGVLGGVLVPPELVGNVRRVVDVKAPGVLDLDAQALELYDPDRVVQIRQILSLVLQGLDVDLRKVEVAPRPRGFAGQLPLNGFKAFLQVRNGADQHPGII